jgi:hypothetical protein
VRGQFRDSQEYGGGVTWPFLPTKRLWLTAELFKIDRAARDVAAWQQRLHLSVRR